mgnify:CR=1 FL=1
MKVVLLAGGFGSRISEESVFKPKPMIEIGGMPILWHIMKEYEYYGFDEFIICAGYKQYVIKEWFADYFLHNSDITFDFTKGTNDMIIHEQHCEPWKVTVVDTGLNTMTGGRIKRIQKYVGDEPFLMTYGDGVCDVDIAKLVEFHKNHGKIATLTAVMLEQQKGVLDIGGDNAVKSFREKSHMDGAPINAGYMVLNPEIFDYIEGDNTVFEKEPLEKLAKEGELMSYMHKGFWQCMDNKREMDMLLSTGEQQSVALMAMAINKLGYPAISLNAFQCNIYSTSTYSNARIKDIATERINNELEKKNIVIITGFQGVNRHLDVTTLGRGGSDTSAVALAAKLGADLCEIYTDVDGVFTADPRVVKTAKKLDAVTYDEMLELASLGAKVLHNRSVEMAKKYNVELVVRSSLNRSEGTVVKEGSNMEKLLVTGVAADKDTVRISVIGLEDKPGTAFAVFNTLAANNINVDIILQSVGREGTKDISFTVASEDLQHALEVLNANKERLTIQDITWNEKVAKLSIVGAGMMSNPGVAAKMFESLYNSRVNINMISTSEIRITVLIPEEDIEKAMNAVHDGFGLGA